MTSTTSSGSPQEPAPDIDAREPGIADDRAGIYGLPLIGDYARSARKFFDELAPQPDDEPGVVAGKQVLRYGTVAAAGVGAAALAAVVVL
jgi:hypothetical protein